MARTRYSATISYVIVEGSDTPRYGDTLAFTVDTDCPNPHIRCVAYQDGELVYSYHPLNYPPEVDARLASRSWTGGAADAVAEVYYFDGRKTPVIAELDFHVEA